MTPDLQSALAAILGGFGMLVLKEWIPGLIRWATGAATRQKSLIREAEARADELEAERDEARRIVRILEIHGTALTRQLVQRGMDPNGPELSWPKY